MSYTLSDLDNSEPALSKQIRQEISSLNLKSKVVTYWQYDRLFIDINDCSICAIIYQNKVNSIDLSDGMQEVEPFSAESKDENETLITILQLLNRYFAK